MGYKLEPQKVLEAIENCSVEDQQTVLQYAYETIKQLMTDATPVVPGHWVERRAKRVCSVCEAVVCAWAADCTLKYCPNCGSRMDEKEDDSDGRSD